MSVVLPSLRVGDVIAGRYRLDDEIRMRPDTQIWRGWDLRLQRRVSVRLVADGDPTAAPVRSAAQRAAQMHDRTLLSVLDIVEAPGLVGVISEWTEWPTLSYLAAEPMRADQAVELALATGQALMGLHDAGGAHGRLRPGSVHSDADGTVKLRGFEVDAALNRIPEDRAAAVLADVRGVLDVLYLCLTGQWPVPDRRGRIPRPGRLVADVPDELDDLWSRTMAQVGRGQATMGTLMADLSLVHNHLLYRREHSRKLPVGRYLLRAAALSVAGLAVVSLTMTGITQAARQRDAAEAAQSTSDAPESVAQQESLLAPGEVELAAVNLTTLDPFGDGAEYPDLLWNIADDDPATAWVSQPYYSPDAGGKEGFGVVIDLGSAQPITAVDLDLVGTATDFSVLVGNDPWGGFDQFLPVAHARAAGQDTFVRIPRPAEARAVLIWFTRLPEMSNWSWADTGYRAGIRSAKVYGLPQDDQVQSR